MEMLKSIQDLFCLAPRPEMEKCTFVDDGCCPTCHQPLSTSSEKEQEFEHEESGQESVVEDMYGMVQLNDVQKPLKEVNLRPFSEEKLNHCYNILVTAPIAEGKTTIVKELLSKTPYLHGLIYSNEYVSLTFKGCRSVTDLEEIPKLMKGQAERIAAGEETPAVVVFDDFFQTFRRIPDIISHLLMNARHYQISVILSTQYAGHLKPVLRKQFDYVFMRSFNDNRQLYNHFGGAIPNLGLFLKTLDVGSVNFRFLVINQRDRDDPTLYYRVGDDE